LAIGILPNDMNGSTEASQIKQVEFVTV